FPLRPPPGPRPIHGHSGAQPVAIAIEGCRCRGGTAQALRHAGPSSVPGAGATGVRVLRRGPWRRGVLLATADRRSTPGSPCPCRLAAPLRDRLRRACPPTSSQDLHSSEEG